MSTPAEFATVALTLTVAHLAADHWPRTRERLDQIRQPGWPGRWACAEHAVGYAATAIIALCLVAWRTGIPLADPQTSTAFAAYAVGHYLADRHDLVERLAALARLERPATALRTGGPVGVGTHGRDLSWHLAVLLTAALLITA